jgi:hypothetical protein
MCLKRTSSLFATTSREESLSPTFLFLALVATPSLPEDMITTIVFLFGRGIFVRLSFGEMVVEIPHKMREL